MILVWVLIFLYSHQEVSILEDSICFKFRCQLSTSRRRQHGANITCAPMVKSELRKDKGKFLPTLIMQLSNVLTSASFFGTSIDMGELQLSNVLSSASFFGTSVNMGNCSFQMC